MVVSTVAFTARGENVVKQLEDARQVYSTRKRSFDPQQRAIVGQHIALLEKRIEGSDSNVIEAYDRLYKLSACVTSKPVVSLWN